MSDPQATQSLAPGTVVIEPWPGIGDMVWHLPAMRALAASDPSGRIDIVAREKIPVRELLRQESLMQNCLPLPMGRGLTGRVRSVRTLAETLRRRNYKRAFIFHDSLRYALAARLAGIPEIFGYGFGLQKYLLTQKTAISSAAADRFPLKRANAMLDLAGVARHTDMPTLTPGADALAKVMDKYAAMPKPWVAFAIASLGQNRIWPAERFAAVADRLSDSGWRSIFLLGVARERPIAETIVTACLKAKPAIVTDSPLDETIALLSSCAFALCNDSGLMNIAAALRAPVYVPFGVPAQASGGYDLAHVTDLCGLFAPYVHAILPVHPVDSLPDASKITVEQILEAMRQGGVFDLAQCAV